MCVHSLGPGPVAAEFSLLGCVLDVHRPAVPRDASLLSLFWLAAPARPRGSPAGSAFGRTFLTRGMGSGWHNSLQRHTCKMVDFQSEVFQYGFCWVHWYTACVYTARARVPSRRNFRCWSRSGLFRQFVSVPTERSRWLDASFCPPCPAFL
eukprot:SAG11_NODE_464_length_9216_cov_131.568326_12_plen_151_part_00